MDEEHYNAEENQFSVPFTIKSSGRILFGHNASNHANFLRLSSAVSPSQVKDYFFRRRQAERPSLVLSIIGSVREYRMKSRLVRLVRQGLLKVAKTTGYARALINRKKLWIITTGIQSSITKMIGEIIRTNPDPFRPIHLIGIDAWSSIENNEDILIENQIKPDDPDPLDIQVKEKQFIFLDDPIRSSPENENDFRSRFERAIVGKAFLSADRHRDDIPLVLLLINGDVQSIEKVHQSVVHYQIPVVILEGTGDAADLFATSYHLYNEHDLKRKDSSSSDEKIEQLQNRIRMKLKMIHDEQDVFPLIYECLEKCCRLINLINFKFHHHHHSDQNLDLAILQALLTAIWKKNPSEISLDEKLEQFNLALEWNRIDIVENIIMKNEKNWNKINLNHLFLKALRGNQIGFIQLFLDQDFPLNRLFRNPYQLVKLYQQQNYVFKHHSNNPLKTIYRDIIQPLIGSFFQIDAIFPNASTNSSNIDIDVDKELFFWSILTGKHELALLFWSRGKNKICAALIATLLYKSKAIKEKDGRFRPCADQFENLAVQILEKFYCTNLCQCNKAIIRQIPQYGNVTWLHLAVMAEAKIFIAQRAVQNVLNSIWYGLIDVTTGHRLIIFSSLMLWYSGFLPYHEELGEIYPRRQLNEVRIEMKNNLTNDDDDASNTTMPYFTPETKPKLSFSTYWRNIGKFVDASYVKYLYNIYSHIMFLILFSYVILCDFFPLYDFQSDKCIMGTEENLNRESKNATESLRYGLRPRPRPSNAEYILTFWMFSLFCEEIRQMFSMELNTISGKFFDYMSIFWNQLDLLSLILYFLAFVLRFIRSADCFCAARILLAVDLSIWFIRTLDIFSAVKQLGPKLFMIGQMVHDLKFFMFILTVFILAFGVPAFSLIYGVEEFSWHLPRLILNTAYWQIFGELQIIDEIEKNYDISGYVLLILLVAYMTVASVLLINLLIAMFSNTFDRLQSDTDCIWKYQHYALVSYHLTRPSLPPPLIIIPHLWHLIIHVCSKYFRWTWFQKKYLKLKEKEKFRIIIDDRSIKTIEILEEALGNEVYYSFAKIHRKQIDQEKDFDEDRIHSPQEMILSKMKLLENQVRSIQNQQEEMFEYLQSLSNGIEKILGDELERPQRSSLH